MKNITLSTITILVIAAGSNYALAFNSGSTGVDGALNITVDTEIALPPNGIFNYTDITVAPGVFLSFTRNATNTPVYLLASGNVIVNGNIDISGSDSATNDDAIRTDDGQPGIGGPGGFDGGRGGYLGSGLDNDGAAGRGPGGGQPGTESVPCSSLTTGVGGGGGGYMANGSAGQSGGVGGVSYGTNYLIPLIGGSGGGGGSGQVGDGGGLSTLGSGGGGGGGAIMIAASGTVTITGTINADGGRSGNTVITTNGNRFCFGGGTGGGGSGGAIRIIASTLSGSGTLQANGGIASGDANQDGGNGSSGRIRLEADIFQWSVATSPTFSSSAPNPVFVSNLPGVTISNVAGIAAPSAPTGFNDIVLPDNTPNPVSVEFSTVDIPTGGTIELTATPNTGSPVTVSSGVITGTEANGLATASIDLPNGPSQLIATTTFLVTADLGRDFSRYAMGEKVREVKVSYVAGQGTTTIFVSESGNEYSWPSI